jgi:hypothetical protein
MSFWVSLRIDDEEVFDLNITHSTNETVERCMVAAKMPRAVDDAGSYSERAWGRLAGHVAGSLQEIIGRAYMESLRGSREDEFLALQPANGWGSLTSVRDSFHAVLRAAMEYPTAVFHVHG